MTKLKIGDKVRCYSFDEPYDGEVTEVFEKTDKVMLTMLAGPLAGAERIENRKACRKIWKKPRARIWADESLKRFRITPPLPFDATSWRLFVEKRGAQK